MHATQDVIHPEIGHQYCKESRNHIDVKEQRLFEWNAIPYTRNVINAQTSLGSHAQYRPHDTFAQTAPMKMPAPKKKFAG